jgi:hypothetical protein
MGTIRFTYRPMGLSNTRPAAPETPAAGTSENGASAMSLERVKVDRWWRESSFDLWQGLEVREDPPDTMPAQWLDDLDLPPADKP